MTLTEAIAACANRNLNFADVEALLANCPGPPTASLDSIAFELARMYASGGIDFTVADELANVVFAFAAQRSYLGGTLHSVFLAFDAGEFIPPCDARETDPEAKYTRPQIAKILATVGRSNKSLERTRDE